MKRIVSPSLFTIYAIKDSLQGHGRRDGMGFVFAAEIAGEKMMGGFFIATGGGQASRLERRATTSLTEISAQPASAAVKTV